MWLPAAAGLLLFFGVASAAAEPVPETAIQSQHKACLASCTNAGAPADRCDTACSCADDEVRKNFTLEEYLVMGQAMGANPQAPVFPPDIKVKVDRLLQTCYQ